MKSSLVYSSRLASADLHTHSQIQQKYMLLCPPPQHSSDIRDRLTLQSFYLRVLEPVGRVARETGWVPRDPSYGTDSISYTLALPIILTFCIYSQFAVICRLNVTTEPLILCLSSFLVLPSPSGFSSPLHLHHPERYFLPRICVMINTRFNTWT